ncbi:MAG: hypothetical protein GC162_14330 [Planctomycetes bacterium]|nr:hypothetical protein [Planctomycetota bacterium]
MTLPHGFESRLEAMPDHELLDMIGHGSEYTPEALAAARREVERREIDPTVARKVETALQEEAMVDQARANRPLPWVWRIINFVFPFGIPQMLIADRYGMKGYERCRRECWSWMRRGLLFWVISFVGIIALDAIWPIGDREWVGWLIMLLSLAIVLLAPRLIPKRSDPIRRRAA